MPPLKTRIAATARRLFLDQGVDGVSMRKIAGQVGVSATAIYRHYRDKDDLLDEITEDGFSIFRDYLTRAVSSGRAAERVRGLARGYLDFALDHPRYYDFIFIIPRHNVRRFPDEMARRDDLSFHLLVEQVRQAMSEGAFVAGDPSETALTIWAHVHGLTSLHRAGRFGANNDTFRALYNRSVERLFTGIEVPGEVNP